jgi:hypothetical protein
MLLQTNSYIVPKEKRAEHSRLIRRFRQTLLRLGCDHFEVYEQVGSNWSNSESAGRYVQILRFLDRKHQLAVQAAERSDPTAQAVIADFCDLINFPYQQQQGLFAVGFYTSVLPVAPKRGARGELVSTVEHEVVNDPDAEKPYPGASDGPPLEEGALDENGEPVAEVAAEQHLGNAELVEEPLGGEEIHEPEFNDLDPVREPAEQTSSRVKMQIEGSETEDFLKAESADMIEPLDTPEIPELNLPEHSDDEFMKLVGDDLDEHEPTEDGPNGFIEAEPAHKQDGKDRPPTW